MWEAATTKEAARSRNWAVVDLFSEGKHHRRAEQVQGNQWITSLGLTNTMFALADVRWNGLSLTQSPGRSAYSFSPGSICLPTAEASFFKAQSHLHVYLPCERATGQPLRM